MHELTNEELETLTDAFFMKTRFRADDESADAYLRGVIQQVIVDTWLTCEGTVTIEQWGEGS